MKKIVVNRCYGGFGLSHEAILEYAKRKGVKLFIEKKENHLMPWMYWTVPEGERLKEITHEQWALIAGSSNMSLHSYAIAIDLNYEGNELGDSTPAMDRNVVKIFKKHGFFWGGDYRGRKDGMHFEWYDRD